MRLMTTKLARKCWLALSHGVMFSLLAAFSSVSAAVDSGRDHIVDEAQRWQVNLPEGVTEVSRNVYDLHMLIFWICVAIGVILSLIHI